MKTRKHLFLFVLCALSLSTLVGCKKAEQETFHGNDYRPLWSVSADYDYTSSMTAVVKVDLKALYPEKAADWELKEDDLVAAFSGETCLGVASPKEGLFFLYIAGPTSNSDATSEAGKISLRYYSTHYKNLFEAKDVIVFQNDANLGTVAEPLVPVFVVAK